MYFQQNNWFVWVQWNSILGVFCSNVHSSLATINLVLAETSLGDSLVSTHVFNLCLEIRLLLSNGDTFYFIKKTKLTVYK